MFEFSFSFFVCPWYHINRSFQNKRTVFVYDNGTDRFTNRKKNLSEIKYRTLNHEGGMKVTVLEILKSDVQNNESGKWLYVLLTSPMWVDNGEWIKRYQKFLIFLPDNMPVFDFEE